MILFCNLVRVYVHSHKICDEKFDSLRIVFMVKSKRSRATMHISTMPMTPAWSRDDAKFWQDISTPFNILIKFKATEYSYSIYILNSKNIQFDLSEIPDSSILLGWY